MSAVMERQEQPPSLPATATPAALLRLAVEQGADLDRLERLMELQRKWEAEEARKAYVSAMAEFKKTPPTIYKDKHVAFPNSKGGLTEYDHATIGNVVGLTVQGLAQHGFSHRWETEQLDGGMIQVTCLVTHSLGHSERTVLMASRDDSGGKNNIQALASTVTYLQRYTLLSACGLATRDMPDDDGRGSEIECITEEQEHDLVRMLDDAGADRVLFLKYFKVPALGKLPAKAFKDATDMIRRKKEAAK